MVAEKEPSFRGAVLLMTATSFLVPFAGLITAPILARALGSDGRGEMAAALAPAALMLSVATIGLPDALTYHLAKRPSITRLALLWASLATLALGALCVVAISLALPFLSADDPALGGYIVLAATWTIPALVFGVFRGAATGRQLWRFVAVERVVNTSLRVISFVTLWALGLLTVYSAVLVSVLVPLAAGIVYVVLLAKPPSDLDQDTEHTGALRPVFAFGLRIWLGSVASMLLDRMAPLLMAPLSSVEDLGYYSVANTVSDLPLIIALAITGTLFGVNSRTTDTARVTLTSRLTLLVGFLGCAVLGGILPLWIAPLFGSEFTPSIVPTIMLLISTLMCIPGLMAGAGLSSWGRPEFRSIGLGVAVLTNVGVFVALVPPFGVLGAAWCSIITNFVLSAFMVLASWRIMGVSPLDFFLIRGSDVVRVVSEARSVVFRILRRDRG